MQDGRQRQEGGATVETAEVHPCSLEIVLARRGWKPPCCPGFGTWRQAGALASAQVTLGGLQLWVPQGVSCRVTGVQHGDLGAKGVGGTETSLLPAHGDLTRSPESSLCSAHGWVPAGNDLEAQTLLLNKVGGHDKGQKSSLSPENNKR